MLEPPPRNQHQGRAAASGGRHGHIQTGSVPDQWGARVAEDKGGRGLRGRSEGRLDAPLRRRRRPPASASPTVEEKASARLLYPILAGARSTRFHSVAVITSALHAEGPGFEPQWNQAGKAVFSFLNNGKEKNEVLFVLS